MGMSGRKVWGGDERVEKGGWGEMGRGLRGAVTALLLLALCSDHHIGAERFLWCGYWHRACLGIYQERIARRFNHCASVNAQLNLLISTRSASQFQPAKLDR